MNDHGHGFSFLTQTLCQMLRTGDKHIRRTLAETESTDDNLQIDKGVSELITISKLSKE